MCCTKEKMAMEGLIVQAVDRLVKNYLSLQYEGEVKVHTRILKETDELVTFSVCLGLDRGINFHTLQHACNTMDSEMSLEPNLSNYGSDSNIWFFLSLKKTEKRQNEKTEEFLQ